MRHKDEMGNEVKIPYCGYCGGGQITHIHVGVWEELYYDRYGYTYIEGTKRVENSKGSQGIDSFL